MPRPPLPALALAAGLAATLAAAAPAGQNPQPPAPQPGGAAGGDPLRQRLDKIVAASQAIEQQFGSLRQQYQRAADEAARQQIIEQSEQLNARYDAEIEPAFEQLTEQAVQATFTDPEVGQFALARTLPVNRYEDAERVAERILELNPQNKAVLGPLGLAEYAQLKLDEAEQHWAEAKAAGSLPPQFLQYADGLPEMKRHWAEEQRKRAEQASMNLPRVKFTIADGDGNVKGDVLIELFEVEAPNTVANIISLVEKGYYDGIRFHRVLPNFMVQVGDPNTKEAGRNDYGTGGPGYNIPSEYTNPGMRRHFSGSLSMANTGQPDTGGSQFFITHLPQPRLDGDVGPSRHTVFGRVVEGLGVVRGITPAAPDAPGYEITETDVIRKAEVVRKTPGKDYTPKTLPATR